ncbi:hypothetical protein HAX54_026975 [Datura stramonium]|uniref:Uncharacterized protein n=1 Tax=Datura stramonium TaxID=4076 RepID=A0ABS8V274_DATST|nr:hypothetical protein [Datura stramonium]
MRQQQDRRYRPRGALPTQALQAVRGANSPWRWKARSARIPARCSPSPPRWQVRSNTGCGSSLRRRCKKVSNAKNGPCKALAVLGDGRREAPNSPCDGACATALLQRVGRRAAALDAATT